MSPFARWFQAQVLRKEGGEAELLLPVREEFIQGQGLVHGGILAALLDSALGQAVESLLPSGARVVTVELSLSYLAPVRQGVLRARGWVLAPGRRVFHAAGEVLDEGGTPERAGPRPVPPRRPFSGRWGMFLEQFRLDGKVALVTGGSRGLGLEAALALKEAGAKVAVMARRAAFFAEAKALLGDALYLEGDVRSEERLQAIVDEVERALGPLTVLVNAAGVTWGAPSWEMPAEKVREVLEVNVLGAFLASRAAAQRMRERGYGKIIHIASVAGLKGEPPEILDAVGYSASKGGVVALTRDLAVKWGRWGIRVNALAPGFFPTRMTERLLPQIEARLQQTLPLGRPGRPGELGGAVLFLASPASDYVTGVVLPVDGGATAL